MTMLDNKATIHYAIAEYLPNYRCMIGLRLLKIEGA